MKIKKGTRWVCIKDVVMEGTGEVAYIKGNVYLSEQDGCLTNEQLEVGHFWLEDSTIKEYFIPQYQLDKVYTKPTALLEKIFDKYEGKKVATTCGDIKFFDNVNGEKTTGWFVSTSWVSEDYYQERGYTYLSEKAFIEFMDLGKYIGSLNAESEEEVDYLKIAEEWSKEGESEEEVKESERILTEAKQRQEEHDAINPQHYNQYSIQPLDYIEANGLDFCEGNVIKYVSRYKQKNGLEDLKKAQVYLQKLIDRYDRPRV